MLQRSPELQVKTGCRLHNSLTVCYYVCMYVPLARRWTQTRAWLTIALGMLRLTVPNRGVSHAYLTTLEMASFHESDILPFNVSCEDGVLQCYLSMLPGIIDSGCLGVEASLWTASSPRNESSIYLPWHGGSVLLCVCEW